MRRLAITAAILASPAFAVAAPTPARPAIVEIAVAFRVVDVTAHGRLPGDLGATAWNKAAHDGYAVTNPASRLDRFLETFPPDTEVTQGTRGAVLTPEDGAVSIDIGAARPAGEQAAAAARVVAHALPGGGVSLRVAFGRSRASRDVRLPAGGVAAFPWLVGGRHETLLVAAQPFTLR